MPQRSYMVCFTADATTRACPQDTITINHRFSNDHLIKLSISHALSQSTKLCVFEERVIMIVMNTKDLPGTLAATGTKVAPNCLRVCVAKQDLVEALAY